MLVDSKGFKTSLRFRELPSQYNPEIKIMDSGDKVWAWLHYASIGSCTPNRSVGVDIGSKAWKALMMHNWLFKGVELPHPRKLSQGGGMEPLVIHLKAELLGPKELVPILEVLEKETK